MSPHIKAIGIMMVMWMWMMMIMMLMMMILWERFESKTTDRAEKAKTSEEPGRHLGNGWQSSSFVQCALLIVFNIITETKMVTNHHRQCLFQPSSHSTEGIEQQWGGGRMHLEEVKKS